MVQVYRRRGRSTVIVGRRGGARTLRIDGTFASWYEPGTTLTGSVWDALAAPVLALPEERRRSFLVLGLGGASAARILRAIAPSARITGVEIDPHVVEAARRFFDLDEMGLEVAVEDAAGFLARDGSRYDLVVDDVFVGRGRRARKPAWLPEPGLEAAARRLAPGGVLVTNSLDEAPAVRRTLRRLLPHALRLVVDDYDNQVFAGSPSRLSARSLRTAIAASPVLAPALARLSIRTLRDGPGRGD